MRVRRNTRKKVKKHSIFYKYRHDNHDEQFNSKIIENRKLPPIYINSRIFYKNSIKKNGNSRSDEKPKTSNNLDLVFNDNNCINHNTCLNSNERSKSNNILKRNIL